MSDDEHLIENIIHLVESVGWDKFCDFPLIEDEGEYYKEYGINGNITVDKETFKWLIAMASYIDYHRKVWDHFLPTKEDITDKNELVYKFLEYRNKTDELSYDILKMIYSRLSQEEFFKDRGIGLYRKGIDYEGLKYNAITIELKNNIQYHIFIRDGKLFLWWGAEEYDYRRLEEFMGSNYNRDIQQSIKYLEDINKGGKND